MSRNCDPTAIAASAGEMTSFDAACGIVAAIAKPLGRERVGLFDADGRVLAASVIARHNAPATAVSAMDGYAVRDADVEAVPVRLNVVGASFAGRGYCGALAEGDCVRIFTGAPLPREADRVIIQEDVVADGSTATILAVSPDHRHVRLPGSDFCTGETLLPAGQRLGPQHLVAAAAADADHLVVFRAPRVWIICCGDELAEPGTAGLALEKIPESITWGVAALVKRYGGIVAARELLKDDLALLEAHAAAALEAADVVVMIGGASVGEKDFAKAAFASLGLKLLFKKMAIKPGKPVWLGEAGGIPVVGLPGNPTSALVTARLVLAPLIAGMAGRDPRSALRWQPAKLPQPVRPCADKDTFLRAARAGDGLIPMTNQDSANQKALADADLLVRIRADAHAAPVQTAESIDL